MAGEFWLSDRQWAAIDPLLPKNQSGAHRVDDRRVISGIIHVLKVGCRWQDCPAAYGPPTTIYNRFRRWTIKGVWRRLFAALVELSPGDVQMIDSTSAKAHRSAGGGKGGPKSRRSAARAAVARPRSTPSSTASGRLVAFEITAGQRGDAPMARSLLEPLPNARLCLADTAYDADKLRAFLIERGTTPVIPNNPTRKNIQPFDPDAYKQRKPHRANVLQAQGLAAHRDTIR